MAEADDRSDFLARTEAFVSGEGLIQPGEAVVVGVSGGADSVALAAALRGLGRYRLHVAHVHHGLRAEADADAEFVAALARSWQVPFHAERIDTPALAASWKVGIEQAARRGRYEALAGIARGVPAEVVAVAHHADDQVETVLHRIFRGTHLRGLAGMSPRRVLEGAIRLVRPLLWARRDEIERFCRAEGLTWRTDQTNAMTEWTRNFIRHDFLPLVRGRLNPRADEAVLRLASAARRAEEALEDLAGRLFRRSCRKRSSERVVLRVGPLRKAPAALAALVLRQAVSALAAPEQDWSEDRFADLLALVAGEVPAADLPGGVRAVCDGRQVVLTRSPPASAAGEPGGFDSGGTGG